MKIEKQSIATAVICALFASIFLSAPAQAALGVGSVTSSPITTGGGGASASANCNSPRVITKILSYTYPFDGTNVLSKLSASCATLAGNGLTISATGSQTLGPYATESTGSQSEVACSTNGGNSVLVGARVYKSASGYAAGVKLLCGNLPDGSSRAYVSTVIGTTTGTYEDIACNTGSVAIGLNIAQGSILDKFGMNCAQLTGSGQNITISTLGTSSKIYPYSQALSVSTTGSLGSGAITYAISTGGTATSCALSNATSTAAVTASSNGTCLIAATIAAGGGYDAATSSAATFTFSLATQSALSLSSTSGTFGTALTLTTSGGSGGGALSYVYATGTITCSLSGTTLTADGSGTCLITATKAADSNYNLVVASQTAVTFAVGSTTASITFAPGDLVYRQVKLITVIASAAGKVTFKVAGKVLPGCKNKMVSAGNSYTATCSYKPSNRTYVEVTATLVPTSASLTGVVSRSAVYLVANRTGTR